MFPSIMSGNGRARGRACGGLRAKAEHLVGLLFFRCFALKHLGVAPLLALTSYLPDGSLGGNQLASVPVEVAANQMQSWQAGYDMSVAAMIHGQEIDQIEFYCTNQDQEIQDLQGTSFSATVKIDWSDPIHLRAGEYGAERDPAVGAYDVEFRHER